MQEKTKREKSGGKNVRERDREVVKTQATRDIYVIECSKCL